MRTTVAESGVVLIELEGVFDGPSARRLEAVLIRAEPSIEIRVDLTRVGQFHDFAVCVLAQALTRTPARVAVSGLRHHQARMLRYFGAALPEHGTLPDAA